MKFIGAPYRAEALIDDPLAESVEFVVDHGGLPCVDVDLVQQLVAGRGAEESRNCPAPVGSVLREELLFSSERRVNRHKTNAD